MAITYPFGRLYFSPVSPTNPARKRSINPNKGGTEPWSAFGIAFRVNGQTLRVLSKALVVENSQ
jgi:hypothetical protein